MMKADAPLKRDIASVEVSVSGSLVTLGGKVHSWAECSAAPGVVVSAPGMTQVVNRLSVEG